MRSKPIPRISLQTSPLMDFAPKSSHHSWEGTSWEENQCILCSSFAFFRKRTGDPKDRIRSSFSLFTANNFQLCTEFGGYLCVHILQPELFRKGCFVSGSFSLPFPLYICSHSSEEHGNASRDPPHSLNGDKRTSLEKSNCLKVVHMPLWCYPFWTFLECLTHRTMESLSLEKTFKSHELQALSVVREHRNDPLPPVVPSNISGDFSAWLGL